MSSKSYYVYLATNYNNTTLYTGVTNNLERRAFEHRTKQNNKSFSAQYNIFKVVYAEEFSYVYDAIAREKQIKGWSREKKNELVNSVNPEWNDFLKE